MLEMATWCTARLKKDQLCVGIWYTYYIRSKQHICIFIINICILIITICTSCKYADKYTVQYYCTHDLSQIFPLSEIPLTSGETQMVFSS